MRIITLTSQQQGVCDFLFDNKFMEKYGYEQWKKVSTDLHRTKQNMEEMSKLYIIAHTRVKTILRKVQTDLHYDPTPDCQAALEFVKSILQRLANRHADEYLSKIDPSVLDKYQQHYFGLMELLSLALMTQSSKNKINVHNLLGVRQKHNRKDEFSLKGELKKSEQRVVRTKSGHRITRQLPKQTPSTPSQNQYTFFQELVAEKDNIIDDTAFQTQCFLQKRQHLEQTINKHIEKQGYSINFRNKYAKLDEYLQERKQFADLIFCQKYYERMIEEGQIRKNETKISDKKDPDMAKIFPEFNIKTKYMKRHVKDNVLKVIFDVKKELLQEYHLSNVAKMQEGTQNGMVKVAQRRKSQPRIRPVKSETSSATTLPERFKSTNRIKNPFFRQTMKSMGNTRRQSNPNTTTKKLAWEGPLTEQAKLKLTNRIMENKIPIY